MWPTADAAVLLLLCLWYAVSWGVRPLTALAAAAAVHEAGHVLALRLCGARILGIRPEPCGLVLDADLSRLSYAQELLCVLAGPIADLVPALVLARAGWTMTAGACLVLCLYALLPIPPLDGGRALILVCSWLAGPDGERAARRIGGGALVLACAAAVWLVRYSGGSLWLIPAVGCLAVSWAREGA